MYSEYELQLKATAAIASGAAPDPELLRVAEGRKDGYFPEVDKALYAFHVANSHNAVR